EYSFHRGTVDGSTSLAVMQDVSLRNSADGKAVIRLDFDSEVKEVNPVDLSKIMVKQGGTDLAVTGASRDLGDSTVLRVTLDVAADSLDGRNDVTFRMEGEAINFVDKTKKSAEIGLAADTARGAIEETIAIEEEIELGRATVEMVEASGADLDVQVISMEYAQSATGGKFDQLVVTLNTSVSTDDAVALQDALVVTINDRPVDITNAAVVGAVVGNVVTITLANGFDAPPSKTELAFDTKASAAELKNTADEKVTSFDGELEYDISVREATVRENAAGETIITIESNRALEDDAFADVSENTPLTLAIDGIVYEVLVQDITVVRGRNEATFRVASATTSVDRIEDVSPGSKAIIDLSSIAPGTIDTSGSKEELRLEFDRPIIIRDLAEAATEVVIIGTRGNTEVEFSPDEIERDGTQAILLKTARDLNEFDKVDIRYNGTNIIDEDEVPVTFGDDATDAADTARELFDVGSESDANKAAARDTALGVVEDETAPTIITVAITNTGRRIIDVSDAQANDSAFVRALERNEAVVEITRKDVDSAPADTTGSENQTDADATGTREQIIDTVEFGGIGMVEVTFDEEIRIAGNNSQNLRSNFVIKVDGETLEPADITVIDNTTLRFALVDKDGVYRALNADDPVEVQYRGGTAGGLLDAAGNRFGGFEVKKDAQNGIQRDLDGDGDYNEAGEDDFVVVLDIEDTFVAVASKAEVTMRQTDRVEWKVETGEADVSARFVVLGQDDLVGTDVTTEAIIAHVFNATEAETVTPEAGTSELKFSLDGLASGTDHRIAVVYFDGAGNSRAVIEDFATRSTSIDLDQTGTGEAPKNTIGVKTDGTPVARDVTAYDSYTDDLGNTHVYLENNTDITIELDAALPDSVTDEDVEQLLDLRLNVDEDGDNNTTTDQYRVAITHIRIDSSDRSKIVVRVDKNHTENVAKIKITSEKYDTETAITTTPGEVEFAPSADANMRQEFPVQVSVGDGVLKVVFANVPGDITGVHEKLEVVARKYTETAAGLDVAETVLDLDAGSQGDSVLERKFSLRDAAGEPVTIDEDTHYSLRPKLPANPVNGDIDTGVIALWDNDLIATNEMHAQYIEDLN
nr:hypothetical protein [Alphaproteobacteria bacterium]